MRIVLLFSAAIVLSLPALSQDRGTVLSMQGFLDAVKEQSPDLAITKANSSAARARASGIRLAPPMVGFMQMKEGSSRANGLEVSQEIPFPTKIYSERKVRQLDAQAQEENSSTQSATILAEARLAYVSFWNAAERLEI